jgi:hypothetical protein
LGFRLLMENIFRLLVWEKETEKTRKNLGLGFIILVPSEFVSLYFQLMRIVVSPGLVLSSLWVCLAMHEIAKSKNRIAIPTN